MAGQLTIDTLKASSGVLATQNGMTGIAKAWANFNSVTPSIRKSFNVSSITKNGTGDITLNLTTALDDVNYAFATGSVYEQSTYGSFSAMRTTQVNTSTTSLRILTFNSVGGATDFATGSVVIFD